MGKNNRQRRKEKQAKQKKKKQQNNNIEKKSSSGINFQVLENPLANISKDDRKKIIEEINKEIKNINTTLKDKKYIISTKLSILDIEKKDDYIQFIFSNGQIFKIQREEIANIGLNDIEKVYLNNGDLTDHSINKRFTVEEIFYNISNYLSPPKD